MNTQPFQLTTLSQSSLQDYMDCARRFKLRYLDRLSYPAVETEPTLENEKHQQEGEYFHRLVQQHLIGIPAERIASDRAMNGLRHVCRPASIRRCWSRRALI